jgi:hypothetical protein
MKLVSLLKMLVPVRLEPLAGPSTESSLDREAQNLRDVVSGHSRGNIYLQMGKYCTESDINAEFEEIAKIDFAA